jgi:hypothetical protein
LSLFARRFLGPEMKKGLSQKTIFALGRENIFFFQIFKRIERRK